MNMYHLNRITRIYTNKPLVCSDSMETICKLEDTLSLSNI